MNREVKIGPISRHACIFRHVAHVGDFREIEWLLRHGTTEIWYEKPENHLIEKMNLPPASGVEPERLSKMSDPAPWGIEIPKVWLSNAIDMPPNATFVDKGPKSYYTDSFPTDREDGLLCYNLVYTTVHNPARTFSATGPSIFTMVKCSSQESALAHIYYAVGQNGWNLAFSCITRCGEGFGERCGKIKKVQRIQNLKCEDVDTDSIRVFY